MSMVYVNSCTYHKNVNGLCKFVLRRRKEIGPIDPESMGLVIG